MFLSPLQVALEPSQVQALLDALPTPVIIKDTDSCFILANKVAQALLEIPFEQLQGTQGAGLMDTEQLARSLAWDREALESSQPTSHEDELWSAQQQSNRWCSTLRTPLLDKEGQARYLFCVLLDKTQQQRAQAEADDERGLLEMLTSDVPLPLMLEAFTSNYERAFPGMLCSVLLLDEDGAHLHHGAAPSLPAAYCEAIDGMTIGMDMGSCGTAAFTGKEVLVSDIETDPQWKNYRDLAAQHGLRACWSTPILSSKGQVLGTFANYHTSPRTAEPRELQALRHGAYMVGLAIDHQLTEKRLLAGQASLRESALHTKAILDNMADGVVTFDGQGTIQSFNKAASILFGYPAVAVIGSDISVLTPAAKHDEYFPHRKKFVDFTTNSKNLRLELEAIRRDGTVFPMALSVSKISTAGRPVGIGIMRDITQRRKNEEEIHRLAFYDPLTELPNRRLLMDRLKQALANSARNGAHAAVMFLDLDHFKQLNDTLGHDMGDILLQEVARRLKTSVREADSVARLGGDEFVVLMEAMSSDSQEAAMQAEAVALKVLTSLGQPYALGENSHTSTPSIGIVVTLAYEHSVEDLLKKADVAMYQAKTAGRNTIRFFDPITQAALDAQAELERDLRRGLDDDEFVLYYQPQVSGNGVTVGNEALVRWKHHSRGMVPPGQFIPLAETTGLILPLGQWVLETACAQLVVWSAHPSTARWTLSVNVSAYQFAQPDFVSLVLLALEKTGANPHRLKLELTESMLVNDVNDIIEKMHTIKRSGVGFSLDDFGTGYSSLNYLKRLPLDQLKVDQSFVRDVLTDPSDAVIARTVVALGHSLGLTVIAEGVETAAQAEFLAGIGCDAFQGYYYGRPGPATGLQPTAAQS